MHFTAIGRCTAAEIADSAADAFCANALANPLCGIQMNPFASGASCLRQLDPSAHAPCTKTTVAF